METLTEIQASDIKEGAKFKTSNGIIWIIDEVKENVKHFGTGTAVRTSMQHGAKGNYRDSIGDVVSFLNDEKAIKL